MGRTRRKGEQGIKSRKGKQGRRKDRKTGEERKRAVEAESDDGRRRGGEDDKRGQFLDKMRYEGGEVRRRRG